MQSHYQKNYDAAIECFNKVIEIDRFCADAYYFKGIAYYHQYI
jgi:lipoprotein NlpI